GGPGGPTPPTTPPKGDNPPPKGNEPQNPSTDTTKGEGEGDTSPKGNIEDLDAAIDTMQGTLPTKSNLQGDLSPQEIKTHIEQWDLNNPKATDRLLIGKVDGQELEQLAQEFNFKGNYALARQIDAQHVAHALNRHGDLSVETSRNQIPITLEDISNYPNIVKSADVREVEGNNIVYKKQINGHYVVVEEALTKKNKINFVTMWKSKGNLTTLPTPSSTGHDLDRTLSESYKGGDSTTPPLSADLSAQEIKATASVLYTKAKEQESGFKELLGTLKQANNRIEEGNTLKTLESLEEKLAYYKGDTSKVNDLLRGAVGTDKGGFNEALTQALESLENNPSVSHISPKFIKTQDGYTGAHINFNFNGVPSEIQLHTPKSWEVKKQLDPLYKAKRRLQLERKLTNKEAKEFRRKMRALAQDSDLDISLLTSFKLTSPQESSFQSVLSKKSGTELNENQDHLLKSNSNPGTSESGNAYSRLESKLNQKSTSLTGGKGIDTDIQTPKADSTTSPLKIEANPAFGENFAEYAGKGAEAVKKLLQEKRGQVSGAFYRPDLGESGGYIDLVWGANAQRLQGLKGANGKPLKPYGLSKIVEKHLEDFSPFVGDTPLEKLGHGIEEIIKSGDLVTDQAGVKTIILKDNGREFRVGVSQGWEHKGKNYWIVTAYENRKSPAQK
ncbi:putative barnase/colicin E5 family endoribonuclease, partial [Helicobacter ailurogastricus]